MRATVYNIGMYKNRMHDLSDAINNNDNIKIFCDQSSSLYNFIFNNNQEDLSIYSLNYILMNLRKENQKNIVFVSTDANVYFNYEKLKEFLNYDLDITVKYFPFIFFSPKSLDFFEEKISKNMTKKYRIISLNNQSRIMRDLVLSELYNYDNFCYSKTNDYHSHSNVSTINRSEFKFYYEDYVLIQNIIHEPYFSFFYLKDDKTGYDGSTRKLLTDVVQTDKNFVYDNYAPDEFFESDVELIIDCHVTTSIVFSEKIFRPLISKKPFIVLSTKHYYKELKKMGFLLYDEIFNYDFDSEPLEIRYNSIIEQCKTLLCLNTEKYNNLIDSVQHKTEHNRNLYLKYYYENNFQPHFLSEKVSSVDYNDFIESLSFGKSKQLYL